MKKILLFVAFLMLTANVFADEHNTPIPSEGSMTTKVIQPLNVTAPFGFMEIEVIQNQTRTLTEDNEWNFLVGGEPGMLVNINFMGPDAFDPVGNLPTLNGQWHGPDGQPVVGNNGQYQIPDYPVDSFFDVFYRLDGIDATGADIGLIEYELGIEYCYHGL
ncbi:MAG: hypothetical protein M9949_11275 [Candidatus Kapabacteria bacterium]|nr:hypothetical protein [Candidatus Kapabacteria bacterium]